MPLSQTRDGRHPEPFTKPEIALQLLRHALADGVPPAPVWLMDPAYGNDSKLQAGCRELGLTYVAGILPTAMVWRPGETVATGIQSGPRPARQAAAP